MLKKILKATTQWRAEHLIDSGFVFMLVCFQFCSFWMMMMMALSDADMRVYILLPCSPVFLIGIWGCLMSYTNIHLKMHLKSTFICINKNLYNRVSWVKILAILRSTLHYTHPSTNMDVWIASRFVFEIKTIWWILFRLETTQYYFRVKHILLQFSVGYKNKLKQKKKKPTIDWT